MKKTVELKEKLSKLQEKNMIVAYCCCGNSRTISTGRSHSATTDPYSTSGC